MKTMPAPDPDTRWLRERYPRPIREAPARNPARAGAEESGAAPRRRGALGGAITTVENRRDETGSKSWNVRSMRAVSRATLTRARALSGARAGLSGSGHLRPKRLVTVAARSMATARAPLASTVHLCGGARRFDIPLAGAGQDGVSYYYPPTGGMTVVSVGYPYPYADCVSRQRPAVPCGTFLARLRAISTVSAWRAPRPCAGVRRPPACRTGAAATPARAARHRHFRNGCLASTRHRSRRWHPGPHARADRQPENGAHVQLEFVLCLGSHGHHTGVVRTRLTSENQTASPFTNSSTRTGRAASAPVTASQSPWRAPAPCRSSAAAAALDVVALHLHVADGVAELGFDLAPSPNARTVSSVIS